MFKDVTGFTKWHLLTIVLFFLFVVSCLFPMGNSRSFFEKHTPELGVVYEYSYKSGKNSVSFLPSGGALLPIGSSSSESYYIYVDYYEDDEHFLLKYRIPEEEYRVHEIGALVEIKDTWSPISYQSFRKE